MSLNSDMLWTFSKSQGMRLASELEHSLVIALAMGVSQEDVCLATRQNALMILTSFSYRHMSKAEFLLMCSAGYDGAIEHENTLRKMGVRR